MVFARLLKRLEGSPILDTRLDQWADILLTFLASRGTRNQLGDGRVAFVDGFVERERHEYTNSDSVTSTSYSYVVYQPQPNAVNQQRFSVNGAAFHALLPGLRYRVYYVPASNKLASIEPLP